MKERYDAEVKHDAPPALTAESVPTPTGYHLLVSLPDVKDTYKSGILKSDVVMKNEEISTMVVQVVDMGPDAYKDKSKFPTGPYCKVGDHILIRAYSGTRFKIHGKEMFRLINDDSVEAVVVDPTGYSRI
jgi:co-chaperonin GroES (HSP10)